MSMFYAFFTINYKDPSDLSRHQELFSNRQIYKERDFCKNYMGKYPVLFLSLKSVSALDFKGALDMMASIINSLADSLNFYKAVSICR